MESWKFAWAALCFAAVGAAFGTTAESALDPARQPHILVGYPAGGPTDILARLFGQWLGQQFVIENRRGAANHRQSKA